MTDSISGSFTGHFKSIISFLENAKNVEIRTLLEEYGVRGVEELSAQTPVLTGKTANSWYYDVSRTRDGWSLSWSNSNMAGDVPVAKLILYGHATAFGSYVPSYDYLGPAIDPILAKLKDELLEEIFYG